MRIGVGLVLAAMAAALTFGGCNFLKQPELERIQDLESQLNDQQRRNAQQATRMVLLQQEAARARTELRKTEGQIQKHRKEVQDLRETISQKNLTVQSLVKEHEELQQSRAEVAKLQKERDDLLRKIADLGEKLGGLNREKEPAAAKKPREESTRIPGVQDGASKNEPEAEKPPVAKMPQVVRKPAENKKRPPPAALESAPEPPPPPETPP